MQNYENILNSFNVSTIKYTKTRFFKGRATAQTNIKDMKGNKALMFSLLTASSLMTTAPASAQSVRGEKTLGITGGYASYNHSGYAGVYFQYSFARHVRIATEVDYAIRNDHRSGLAISCDMHFPFRVARGINVYPLAGLTFNNWTYSGDGSSSRIGGEAGAGFDFYLTQNLKLTFQGKYSFMNDTSGAFAGIGVGYVF